MAKLPTIPELGPLEFKLVRILWDQSPATAREVMEAYNETERRQVKYTTVLTLLTRLVEKGVLLVDRERQPFQFVPKISEEQILKQRTREFVDLFFDGRPVELALRLVESSDLSEESIQRLEAMLVRHRELESGEDSEEVQK